MDFSLKLTIHYTILPTDGVFYTRFDGHVFPLIVIAGFQLCKKLYSYTVGSLLMIPRAGNSMQIKLANYAALWKYKWFIMQAKITEKLKNAAQPALYFTSGTSDP